MATELSEPSPTPPPPGVSPVAAGDTQGHPGTRLGTGEAGGERRVGAWAVPAELLWPWEVPGDCPGHTLGTLWPPCTGGCGSGGWMPSAGTTIQPFVIPDPSEPVRTRRTEMSSLGCGSPTSGDTGVPHTEVASSSGSVGSSGVLVAVVFPWESGRQPRVE